MANEVRSRQTFNRNNQNSGPLAALESTDNPQEYSFPVGELLAIDHWVTFRSFETKQLNRSEVATKKPFAYISLPMPANLTTAYNIDYGEASLGALGQVIADSFGEGASADIGRPVLTGLAAGGAIGLLTGGNVPGAALTGAAGSVLASGQETRASTTAAAASQLISTGAGADATLVQAAVANRGIAANPHKVVLFNAVNFRVHQFQYSFTPDSYEEADALRNIIKLFKFYSSPSFNASTSGSIDLSSIGVGRQSINVDLSAGKHFFKYPEYFEIDFHHPKFLYQIGPSVLESFAIDYHPLGAPLYSRTRGREPTPVQINMLLQFKETEIVTKENIMSENR